MKPTSIALTLAALGNAAFAVAETNIETATINIIGSTPLPGFGIPRDQIPANVQSVGGRRLEEATKQWSGIPIRARFPSRARNPDGSRRRCKPGGFRGKVNVP